MAAEKPLIGVVKGPVSMRRFQIRAHEYGVGENTFEGDLSYPLPFDSVDGEPDALAGWGCGVLATLNCLNLSGENMGVKEGSELFKQMGVVPSGDGVGEHIICQVLERVGRETLRVIVDDSPANLAPYFRKGCLLIFCRWEMSWDENDDSRQRGDGHWTVGAGVNQRGDVLMVDSGMRLVQPGEKPYGVWWLTERAHLKTAQDFNGNGREYLNPAETEVIGDLEWFWQFGILVGPKGAKWGYLTELVRLHGGVAEYPG